ncbi:mechanosensitive ion channel family protein [Planctomycetota bacterium]
MSLPTFINLIASTNWFSKTIYYEIIQGNVIWRFVLVLVIVLASMAAGRIARFFLDAYASHREKNRGKTALTLFIGCLAKPISVAFFALGLLICKVCLVFGDEGISPAIEEYWTKIAQAIAAIALAYALYRLVDVIEYYLRRIVGRTRTKIDDMLVPVIRKSLRVTIAIIAALWIADGILNAEIRAILLSAGVGGIAVALAAKDSIANFFGSITIFADRPFQIDDLVKIEGHFGTIEEVGFRSTKVRTKQGSLVTVPNSVIANTNIENVSKRNFIRRTSNITITYDSGYKKARRAVELIKEILSGFPEVNTNPDFAPKVFFNEFNDWSLNIYMTYWVAPADWWVFLDVNERVNLEMMKRFEDEQIEFAFPSQTLYLKKD